MTRTLISQTPELIGQKVTLKGWVNTIRDHGKLVFIELSDRSGLVQIVGDKELGKLHPQDVIEVSGTVSKRPEEMINKNIQTGEIEIQIEKSNILSSSGELPFPIDNEGRDINEEIRLKYRYLDLKRDRLQKNIRLRSKLNHEIRKYLLEKDFVEIETPMLTKSTKEGARDFVVPSRFQPGKFYALPQSPQQYKQLLMTANFERYFQFARCIRDEDLRADRGFEFTQLDLEMSFASRDEVMQTVEEMVKKAIKAVGGTLQNENFPVFQYGQALEKFGQDKFDLRSDEEKTQNILAFAWVVNFPFFKKVDREDIAEVRDGKSGWTFTHNPFSMPNQENLEDHLSGNNIENIRTQQYDLVCNGFEVGGGSIRTHDPKILKQTFKIMGYSDEEIEASIGHMLKAFSFGTPPHGGIALGMDRLVMLLTNEESLKESIAFPMSSTGRTAVMDAPSEVSSDQLKELGIQVASINSQVSQIQSSPFKKIQNYLDSQKVNYRVFHHEPVTTSEEAAKVRGCKLEEGAKALVVQADAKNLMFVVSGSDKLDLKAVKTLGYKDVSLVSLEILEKLTGLKPGAIPPFGSLFNLPTYLDEKLTKMENINFNAGSNSDSIQMKPSDFVLIEKPEIGKFGK